MILSPNFRIMFFLTASALMAPLYGLTPIQRANIQDLTQEIRLEKITPLEARKKALQLTIQNKNDQIVQALMLTAESKGIPDILDPARTAQVPSASTPTPQKIISNPEVKKLYADFTILNKSADIVDLRTNYDADMRRLRQLGEEFDRMVAQAEYLSKTPLDTEDQKIIDELNNNLFPAFIQKLLIIRAIVDKREIKAIETSAEKRTKIIPESIQQLIEHYVNKEYTLSETIALLKKNTELLGPQNIDQWLDPYEHKITKEELNAYFQEFAVPLLKSPRSKDIRWDNYMVIDIYYYFTLAKIYFKKFTDQSGILRAKGKLVELLAKNGNDSKLIINSATNTTPIKNKYFVEIVDEFEKKQMQ